MYSKSMINPLFGDRNMMNPLIFRENEYAYTVENYPNNILGGTASGIDLYDKIETAFSGTALSDEEYSTLLQNLEKMEYITTGQTRLLFKISRLGLVQIIAGLGIEKKTVEMNIQNVALQNKLTDMVLHRNMHTGISPTSSADPMLLRKTFTLAPIYSYYIAMYGIPEKGFNYRLLSRIGQILKKYGIDPYQ
jgi:hypothetical protein